MRIVRAWRVKEFNQKYNRVSKDSATRPDRAAHDPVDQGRVSQSARQRRIGRSVVAGLAVFALVGGVVAALVVKVVLPNRQYNEAIERLQRGDYAAAYTLFAELGDFRDSPEQILASKYDRALALKQVGLYDAAYALLKEIGAYRDSETQAESARVALGTKQLGEARVGMLVKFGAYEQDNNLQNGSELIEWIVLAKEGDDLLLLSKAGLDAQPFNSVREEVTWADSTLRVWLEETFLQTAFADAELAKIVQTTVENPANPFFGTPGGPATEDRLFLLSLEEAEAYASFDKGRPLSVSLYAQARGASGWWRLRSPGYYQDYAAGVLSFGPLYPMGLPVDYAYATIRPALWVKASD